MLMEIPSWDFIGFFSVIFHQTVYLWDLPVFFFVVVFFETRQVRVGKFVFILNINRNTHTHTLHRVFEGFKLGDFTVRKSRVEAASQDLAMFSIASLMCQVGLGWKVRVGGSCEILGFAQLSFHLSRGIIFSMKALKMPKNAVSSSAHW